MEQQRLLVVDQVLVERERHLAGQAHGRVDAVDALGDFVEVGAGLDVGDGHGGIPVSGCTRRLWRSIRDRCRRPRRRFPGRTPARKPQAVPSVGRVPAGA
jgi:hypothetical protein